MAYLKAMETYLCGNSEMDDVSATLYTDGTLIVRGNGNIKNYSSELPCWFNVRKKIKTIIVMKGIRRIGNSAFAQLPKLSHVSMFDSVEEIGKFAFVGCPKLSKVVIPQESDHEDAFDPHVVVENASVLEVFDNLGSRKGDRVWATLYSNEHLIVEGHGNIDNYKSMSGRTWNHRTEQVSFVTVKNGVDAVGAYSFKGFYTLRSVEIENTKKIGRHAFEACKMLIDVKMNNTVEEIGMNAFASCDSLLDFAVPPTITEIPQGMLSSCKSIKEMHIPINIKTIGSNAFSCCNSLETLTGMTEVESIGEYALYCCKLNSFEVPRKVKNISRSLLGNNEPLSEVFLHEEVESIETFAFGKSKNLTLVKIPNENNLKKIGESAFFHCEKLSDAFFNQTFENLETIEVNAFMGCSEMTNIKIQTPKKLTIKKEAFKSNSLVSVVLPKYVELEADVFADAKRTIRLDVSANEKYSKMSKSELEKLAGTEIA